MRVLVVCDGNICRSPLVAAYLRERAAKEGLSHILVDSAGLLGIEGAPAAPHSMTVAREAGLDLTTHRSRGVRPADLKSADLVLGMTLAHLEQLAWKYPDPGQRRMLLRAFERGPSPEGGVPELDDPVSGPIEEFRETFEVIRTCIDHLVLWLRHNP